MYKFFMQDYVVSFENSVEIEKLSLHTPCAWRWVQIGDQEPYVVFKKWVDEHRLLLTGLKEYKAYMIHELLEALGKDFDSLRYSESSNLWIAIGGDIPYIQADTPQDVLAELLIAVKKIG